MVAKGSGGGQPGGPSRTGTLALAMWVLCAALFAAPAAATPVPAGSRQLLLVTTPSWDATHGHLRTFERPAPGAPWTAAGAPVPVSLGRTGLAWGRGLHDAAAAGLEGPRKKEGDGKAPAGVFDLRLATGYAAAAPPGTKLPYRQATETLRCVDDPGSRLYNQLADEGAVAKDWSSSEDMRRADELYRLVVWVGHNDQPSVPGGGSCIFLHLRTRQDATTAGCTAFDAPDLERLLTWLDPARRPVLVQLPADVARDRSAPWGLPAAR